MVITQEAKEALALEKRMEKADKVLSDNLNKIFKKEPHELTLDEKRTLQARVSYLDKIQLEKYEEVLKEEIPRPDGEDEEKSTENQPVILSRKELENKSLDVGVENPGDKKKYPKNSDLEKAIEEKRNQTSE